MTNVSAAPTASCAATRRLSVAMIDQQGVPAPVQAPELRKHASCIVSVLTITLQSHVFGGKSFLTLLTYITDPSWATAGGTAACHIAANAPYKLSQHPY